MKNREEPSNDSPRGEWSARQTDSLSRPGRTVSASFEQPALSRRPAVRALFPEMLMEAVVSRSNMERAWNQVRSNRGAPGPDGITVDEFIAWARPQWESIVQQLLDGTYRPGPVRRVTIDKPDGGERQLAAFSWKRAKRAGPTHSTSHSAGPDAVVRSEVLGIEPRFSTETFCSWSSEAGSTDNPQRPSLRRGHGPPRADCPGRSHCRCTREAT
jgi:hypothetical protein